MQTKPRIFSLAQFSLSCYALTMGVTLASNGLYITPDSGTYQVDEQVSLSASRGNGQQGLEGQPCCGDSGDGTYEFYDLSNYSWSGDVVDPSGDHADLDTTTPGQKTVNCNADMTFRCTGSGEVTSPTSVSGNATHTVDDDVTGEPPSITVSPNAQKFLVNKSNKITLTVSGGRAQKPVGSGWSRDADAEKIWNYSGITGNPTSGTASNSSTLQLNRDVGTGEISITVKLKQVWRNKNNSVDYTNSPASTAITIRIQEPTSIHEQNITKVWGADAYTFNHELKDQNGEVISLAPGDSLTPFYKEDGWIAREIRVGVLSNSKNFNVNQWNTPKGHPNVTSDGIVREEVGFPITLPDQINQQGTPGQSFTFAISVDNQQWKIVGGDGTEFYPTGNPQKAMASQGTRPAGGAWSHSAGFPMSQWGGMPKP